MSDMEDEDEEFFDNDDDEEDDFVPDADDEEDDEDENNDDDGEDDEDALPFLEGSLTLDDDQKLRYQGSGFRLVSVDPVPWNLLDATERPLKETLTLAMVGPCDVVLAAEEGDTSSSSGARKATPRQLQVTWTAVTHPSNFDGSSNNSNGAGASKPKAAAGLKKSDDSDEDDQKKASSSSAKQLFYQIYGREDANSGPQQQQQQQHRLEFRGGYHPATTRSKDGGWMVGLIVQVRLFQPAAPSPVVAAPAAAAAAAADDDDNLDDAEEAGVDYNELIALHEDAGLSVEALIRKRYRDGAGQPEEEEEEPASASKKNKANEGKASGDVVQNDEEDDDDLEF